MSEELVYVFDPESRAFYRLSPTAPQLHSTENFVPTVEIVDGKTYHLVVVAYTTGDSYHHYDDLLYVVIDAYPEVEDAIACARAIRDHHTRATAYDAKLSFEDKYKISLRLANGNSQKIVAAWCGYFDRLEHVEVMGIVAGANISMRF